MSIADKFKEFRESRGMSQLDVAIQTKTSPAMISKIELGQRVPSVVTAHEIVKALGFKLDDLFTE